MTGHFTENELYRIDVEGNSETIYYVREEDGTLTGINKAFASNMSIRLKDRKIKQIVYIQKPTAVLHPEGELGPTDLILKNFRWLSDRRPMKREDIFVW
jgi:hypothetical protein